MTQKEYNGWSNYETWLVNLWIDNEQGLQSYWIEQAEEHYKQAKGDASDDETAEDIANAASYLLGNLLRDYFEEAKPDVEGLWADLLGAAMSEVNWHEIAEHMVEDVDKEQFAND